jgi:hypothetical protein
MIVIWRTKAKPGSGARFNVGHGVEDGLIPLALPDAGVAVL